MLEFFGEFENSDQNNALFNANCLSLDQSLSLPLIVGVAHTINLVDALLHGTLGEQCLALLSFARLKPFIPRLLATASRKQQTVEENHAP